MVSLVFVTVIHAADIFHAAKLITIGKMIRPATMSVNGSNADVNHDGRSRPFLTHNGHSSIGSGLTKHVVRSWRPAAVVVRSGCCVLSEFFYGSRFNTMSGERV